MKKLFTLFVLAMMTTFAFADKSVHLEAKGQWGTYGLSDQVPFTFDQYVGYKVVVKNVSGNFNILITSVETHEQEVSWSDTPIQESDCIIYHGFSDDGTITGEFKERMNNNDPACTQGISGFNIQACNGAGDAVDVMAVYLITPDGTEVQQELGADGWGGGAFDASAVVLSNIELDIPVEQNEFTTQNGGADVEFDQNIKFDDYSAFPSVCAWGKEDKSDPHPAFVEDGAFVCHATAKVSDAWDNQFWFCAPCRLSKGDSFHISFKYKATAAASIGTQAHANPSNYNHWACIGNIGFTTEWQEFEADVTLDGSMAPADKGFFSIALNLNDYEPANDYYFDDIVIEGTQTIVYEQEGLFIATDQNPSPVEITEIDAEEEVPTITVGTDDAPVSEIWISQKTGSVDLFKSASYTLLQDIEDYMEDFCEAKIGKGASILLPYSGVWKVLVDEEYLKLELVEAGATAIESVNAEAKTVVLYNLAGQRVNNAKGMVVKNGKVQFVK